jgi:hypothetical protein
MPQQTSKPRKAARKPGSELYDRVVNRAQTAIMKASRSARDIAPIPVVADRVRRDLAAASLENFLLTYFPATFYLELGPDHLAMIARLQDTVINGGQRVVAMPRGSGKSAILIRAALWAVLTGRRRFCVIIGATEKLAETELNQIKSELEHNDLLLADWPAACYPVRQLEAQARRCVGQHVGGKRTEIVWVSKRLALPTIQGPDAESSGAVIVVSGITGAVRGLSHTDALGRTVRPDLLLCDDPQDRESAASPTQTADRLAILNGDLLGLAGPAETISAVLSGTVIYPDDMVDQLLGGQAGAWQGERHALVYEFPTNLPLWEEYGRMRSDEGPVAATAFYALNRNAMDAGARVAWPARYRPGELSAIQGAMNLRNDLGAAAFDAEYQNAPAREVSAVVLDPVVIAARTNGYGRGTAPPEVEKITAFIDCGMYLIWWLVAGWSDRGASGGAKLLGFSRCESACG